MSDETFNNGDLYGLEVCLRDLDQMILRAEDAKTDKAVAYALVKTFELTYELAIKTMRKYLIARTLKSDQAQEFDFADLIRLADQAGLLKNGWPAWKQYRSDRGRTVHTYNEAVALAIASHLKDFSDEVHVLLLNLKRRLEEDHE